VVGPAETRPRGSLVQALNSAGTMLAPLFGAYLILGRSKSGTAVAGTVLTPAERLADAHSVILPYALVAVVLVVLAVVIARYPLPADGQRDQPHGPRGAQAHSLWSHRNLVRHSGDLHLPDRRNRRGQPVRQSPPAG
jgi:FHS family L-fucose permease-like MFS transporter